MNAGLADTYPDDAIFFTKKHPEFGCFSNFVGGAEQLFQSAKFAHHPEYAAKILAEKSPAKAKRMGGKKGEVKLTPAQITHWNNTRVDVMRSVIRAKFAKGTRYADVLLSTDAREIVEKSFFDGFWGCGRSGKGANMLGKLLMERRQELVCE